MATHTLTEKQVSTLELWRVHDTKMREADKDFDGWLLPNSMLLNANINIVRSLVIKGLMEAGPSQGLNTVYRLTDEGRYALATYKEQRS